MINAVLVILDYVLQDSIILSFQSICGSKICCGQRTWADFRAESVRMYSQESYEIAVDKENEPLQLA